MSLLAIAENLHTILDYQRRWQRCIKYLIGIFVLNAGVVFEYSQILLPKLHNNSGGFFTMWCVLWCWLVGNLYILSAKLVLNF